MPVSKTDRVAQTEMKRTPFDDGHLTTRHDPDVYRGRGLWVYIGQRDNWMDNYVFYASCIYIRMENVRESKISGLMMSKGHVVASRRRE